MIVFKVGFALCIYSKIVTGVTESVTECLTVGTTKVFNELYSPNRGEFYYCGG